MGHHHHKETDSSQRNLLISALLNLVITVAEIAGGLISNSLALLSDALHNLGDTSAVIIAYFANLVSKRKYSDKKTFGYKRIEILAALFNAVVLIVIIIYLFIEAFKRFQNPELVKGTLMFVVAVIGFAGNLISVILLKRDASKSINIRAAYLHLLGDTISSVLVIAGAVLIFSLRLFWIDPLVTILLGLYLLKETYEIIRQTIGILMQETPHGMDLNVIKNELESLPGIDNIHHVHAWNLTDREIHFECHVDLTEDIKVSDTEHINENIRHILLEKFGITHVTVQHEFNCCDDKNMIHKS
ncbi:MAG: cation transporter [Bacteroidales bacterium]|nr:cation transporter [Bacteroidales bacterium]MBN2763095.1 cation transporter [Bacteroidales bacterium]